MAKPSVSVFVSILTKAFVHACMQTAADGEAQAAEVRAKHAGKQAADLRKQAAGKQREATGLQADLQAQTAAVEQCRAQLQVRHIQLLT